MAYQFYLSVKGKKQGDFKGESRRKGKIDMRGFAHSITSPRDVATGQASGTPALARSASERQHTPLKIYKEWGPATPQFFEALVTNEDLTSVLIEAYNTSADGRERLYFTIKLTDAHISSLDEGFDNALHNSALDTFELEEIQFTYRKIEIENKVSSTSAEDDWSSPSA